MVPKAYDIIVVTGCSLSCGMEINDDKLPPYKNAEQRRVSIWKWYKESNGAGSLSVDELNYRALEKWHEKERERSWPSLLATLSGLPVINLSNIGASASESLINYSDFLKHTLNKKILAIHQLPGIGRMFMRFDNSKRIRMIPGEEELGYDKRYFADKITNVKQKYKARLAKDGYVEKHFTRITQRLHQLSKRNNIDDYYFGNGSMNSGVPGERFLIDDIIALVKDYRRGQLGHPVDPEFNRFVCNKILSIL